MRSSAVSYDLRTIAFWGLCAFSLANPLVAQLGLYFFPSGLAGQSPMQLFQGAYVVIVLVTLPSLCRDSDRLSRRFMYLLLFCMLGLCVIYARIWIMGRISPYFASAERVVYLKIVSAFLLWYYVSLLLVSTEQAERLLNYTLLGSFLCAVWMLFCYATRGGSVAAYAYSGVEASFGSQGIAGKAVAGFLLSSVIALLYTALRTGSRVRAAGAVVIMTAMFLTFDRSAQVAFGCVFLWTAIWWFFLSRPKPGRGVLAVFLAGLVVCVAAYLAHRGTEELVMRWTYDLDRGEIGSGRGTFYMVAWEWFSSQCSVGDFLLGMGFGGIHDLMFDQVGLAVHCHSDLFDMIVTGGVLGIAMYCLMYWAFASSIMQVRVGRIEFGAMCALLVQFGVMSVLTGQMTFPLTMYAFGTLFLCVRVLAFADEACCLSEEVPGWRPGWTSCSFDAL